MSLRNLSRRNGARRAWASTSLALALLLSELGRAAVPGQVNFQGLLLDAGGQPLTASVAIEFALFDAATGGAALWSEAHAGVPVLNGVYDIALGSLTPIPESALAGGSLWLEIRPDGETLTPRQRLLAVPYAIRARDSERLGGFESAYFFQIFHNRNWDGSGPPGTDPREGTADPDGDQLANFMDPDNDGDGLSDSAELAQGSDINLVTPVVTSVTPLKASLLQTTRLTISGANFAPGLGVVFGTQTPTPLNLTPTQFEVDVGPQSAVAAPVVVTLPNGQSDSAAYAFVGVRVFVASQASTGSLGGIAGADQRCNTLAGAAGLIGSFKAWLSDPVAGSPAANFSRASVPYTLVTTTQIADDWDDLVDGSLDAPIDRSELGNTLPGTPSAWTGTLADGTPSGSGSCLGWTSGSGAETGTRGLSNAADPSWSQVPGETRSCDSAFYLYCFEQP